MKSLHLTWVAALLLAWSSADGTRIMTIPQNSLNPPSANHSQNPDAVIAAAAAAAPAAAVESSNSSKLKTRQTAAEHVVWKHSSSSASMLEESAFVRQKERMIALLTSIIDRSPRRRSTWAVIIGIALAVIISCLCCLAQPLASYLAESSRTQHMHDGRLVYEWSQTARAAQIFIRPPDGVSEDDLNISIEPRHLRVGLKDKPFFLDEETYDLVNNQKSSWSIQDNGELEIDLHKVRKAHWPAVLRRTDGSWPSSPSSKLKLKATVVS
mmetsp:Transcript_142194/g.261934  ORF Transcript_142194/g.261934 Transcript_142194/m.261934 type:complete len:268 (+) Transcript_142194:74-877(+)